MQFKKETKRGKGLHRKCRSQDPVEVQQRRPSQEGSRPRRTALVAMRSQKEMGQDIATAASKMGRGSSRVDFVWHPCAATTNSSAEGRAEEGHPHVRTSGAGGASVRGALKSA